MVARTTVRLAVVLAMLCMLAVLGACSSQPVNTAPANDNTAADASAGVPAAQPAAELAAQPAAEPEYIAIIGSDTWREANGSFHLEGSDLQMVMRLDYENGVISLLTLPRDTFYDNAVGYSFDGGSCQCSKCQGSTSNKANYAFHYGFYSVWDGSNYEDAVIAGAERCTEMISRALDVSVKRYAVVDLYTIQDIVDTFGGLEANLPFPIVNFTFYSGQSAVSLDAGWQTLSSWDAMVATRARVPYKTLANDGAFEPYFSMLQIGGALEQDGTRQFVCRRLMTHLMDAGLKWGDSDLLMRFVNNGNVITNVPADEFCTWYDKLYALRGNITVHAASVNNLLGEAVEVNGVAQWVVPYREEAFKAAASELVAGTTISSGYGVEDMAL